MKQTIVVGLLLLLLSGSPSSGNVIQHVAPKDAGIEPFWEKFRDAVSKGNKTAVAGLSNFPISMPYGMASVRNRSQLIRRYRDVFNHDGSSASECFSTAKPVIDPARPNYFTVGCKNLAGDEVIIYTFKRTPAGWKFLHLDNINE
ncbi:MAG TPA: hypothetical protein VJU84_14520 [Pyrinomonadaceae bacterium]|nr:hypothetical protein [Pyrinomonadaceae bacterium]